MFIMASIRCGNKSKIKNLLLYARGRRDAQEECAPAGEGESHPSRDLVILFRQQQLQDVRQQRVWQVLPHRCASTAAHRASTRAEEEAAAGGGGWGGGGSLTGKRGTWREGRGLGRDLPSCSTLAAVDGALLDLKRS